MKLDRNRLSCDRCRRKFKNEVILEYHKVRCSSKWQSDKVSMKPQEKWIGGKKEKTVLVKKQVKVEQQGDDNEQDDNLDLAFFSAKNLELASEADLVGKLESHLGVLAPPFDGEIDVAALMVRRPWTVTNLLERKEKLLTLASQKQRRQRT